MTYRSELEKRTLEQSIMDVVERAMLYRSCLTCNHFDESTEVCALAGSRPPARTIAIGCPSYNQIPPF